MCCHLRMWTPWPQSPATRLEDGRAQWGAVGHSTSLRADTVNTAISGWRQVGTSTEPRGDYTGGRDAPIFFRRGCSHHGPGGSDSPMLEAQTAPCWGEGSRAISSGLPWCGTWTQLPRLWFPPCLKEKATSGSGQCGPELQFPLGFYQQPFCIARCTHGCMALQREALAG